MDKILFVVLFALLMAWLFSVYTKTDNRNPKDETDGNEQEYNMSHEAETALYEDEEPTNTGM
jgi:hypothetical protein